MIIEFRAFYVKVAKLEKHVNAFLSHSNIPKVKYMEVGAQNFPFLGKREQLLTPAKRDKAVRLQQSPHHNNNGPTLEKARLEKVYMASWYQQTA